MSDTVFSKTNSCYYHVTRIFLSPFTGLELTPIRGTPDYGKSSLIIPIAMVHPRSIINAEQLSGKVSFDFLFSLLYFLCSLFTISGFEIIPEHPFLMPEGSNYLNIIYPPEPKPVSFNSLRKDTNNILLDILPHVIVKIEYLSFTLCQDSYPFVLDLLIL